MDAIITHFDLLKGYARLRPLTFIDEADKTESSDTPGETEPDDTAEQEAAAIVEELPVEAPNEAFDGSVEVDEPTEDPEEQEETVKEYFFHVSQLQSHTFPGITVGTRVTFEPLEPDSNLVRWVKIQE